MALTDCLLKFSVYHLFEIETETYQSITLDKRFKLVEVPITYKDRPEGSESKLERFSDGFKVFANDFQPIQGL